ncbi:hypothetical protein [Microcoleus sp. F4-D5]|uniref:hypothetical protein n=1 Tax=Microcoleus sp. F4-D5 TaxID=2818760 RepID=UPI002FCED01C
MLTFTSLRLGLENLGKTSSRLDRPNTSTLAGTIAPQPGMSGKSGIPRGSGGSIGGFRQLVIPNAVKGFMISLRSRDFSETWLLDRTYRY